MSRWSSEAAIAYDELQQQCARFRALNADLLEALEGIGQSLDLPHPPGAYSKAHLASCIRQAFKLSHDARAAIARAASD